MTSPKNYQQDLLTLFRALQKQQMNCDTSILDARDLFNREIFEDEENGIPEDRPATPEELGKQDALFVLHHLLWPLARPSYLLDPENPDYEKARERPTISNKKEVLAHAKEIIALEQSMAAYASSYGAVMTTQIQALFSMLLEEESKDL